MEVRDVQERWIERKDEFDELERKEWEEEARRAGALPEASAKVVKANPGKEDEGDELVAAQQRWKEESAKGGGGGMKVHRKQ